jgi:Domain of unknown function (DUF4424)
VRNCIRGQAWRGVIAATALGLSLAAAAPRAVAQSAPPTTEIPTGGLVFAHRDRLFVDQETLTIGIDQIDIDYLIRSTAPKSQTIVFAFPMPTIDMSALAGSDVAIPAFDPANPTNFVAFWTTINGVAVEPEVDLRAHAIGHIDVTAELNRLALPLYPLSPDLPQKLIDLTVDQKSALMDANLISIEDGSIEPLWALRSVFHWRHPLPPDAPLAIHHHYKPVVGSAPWTAEIAATAKSRYCMSDTDIELLDARSAAGKPPTVYWVHYAPGINAWLKGPSSLFKLVIEKPEVTSIAATCASGLKTVGELRIEKSDTGRVDDAEIEVLFVE